MAPRLFLVALAPAATLGCGGIDPTPAGRPVAGTLAVGPDTLSYRVFGQGADTVVALGAEAFGSAYLEPLVSNLGETHTVIVLDPRGRGQSSWHGDSGAFSFEGDVRDVNLLRQRLRISRMSLIGHHSGALVAAFYARRFPDRVNRLVLLTPYYISNEYIYSLSQGVPDSAYDRRVFAALSTEQSDAARFCAGFWGMAFGPAPVTDERVLRELAPLMCGSRAVHRPFREEVTRGLRAALGAVWRLGDTVRAVRAPVLLVEGRPSEDLVGPAGRRVAYLGHNIAAWAAFLPEARVARLTGEAWFPWIGNERAARALLRAFLGGGWPDAARAALSLEQADSVVTRFRDRAGELTRWSRPGHAVPAEVETSPKPEP
jgi:pimeloyl-ACP methyl ester carboxylesterase